MPEMRTRQGNEVRLFWIANGPTIK